MSSLLPLFALIAQSAGIAVPRQDPPPPPPTFALPAPAGLHGTGRWHVCLPGLAGLRQGRLGRGPGPGALQRERRDHGTTSISGPPP